MNVLLMNTRGLGFVVLVFIGAVAILLQPGYHVPPPLFYGAWVVPPAGRREGFAVSAKVAVTRSPI